ncbi:MAG: hypothetical protein CMP59_03780 [Flavobacteriales bacterium]|nr:hypothetical protein [Flavobacteriales bacterium]|tara:strand:+ start:342 stop:989 length:648 start_codon:yes stop_codon:yes gene_type:complete
MKKYFCLFIGLTFLSTGLFAQGLKLNFNAGGIQAAEGEFGIGLAIEPGFQLNEHVAFYLRGEVVSFTRELDTEQELTDVELDASVIGSVSGVMHVYLSAGKVRPFIGIGAGYYLPGEFKIETVTEVSIQNPTAETRYSETISPDPAFGYFPRAGLEIGMFIFILDYHIVDDSRAEYTTLRVEDVNGTTTSRVPVVTDFKNSYLAFKIGLTIGGNK